MDTSWRFIRRDYRGLSLARSTGACVSGTCRDDPIPPGVYWIDVPWELSQFTKVSKRVHWDLWLDAMKVTGWVKVVKTVHHDGELLNDEPPRDWHLFEVTRPAPRWTPETGLGLPTVAPNGIQTTEDDTIQSPPPEDVWDILPSSTSGRILVTSVALGGVALVLYGMTRR